MNRAGHCRRLSASTQQLRLTQPGLAQARRQDRQLPIPTDQVVAHRPTPGHQQLQTSAPHRNLHRATGRSPLTPTHFVRHLPTQMLQTAEPATGEFSEAEPQTGVIGAVPMVVDAKIIFFFRRGSLSETPVTNACWLADLEATVAVEKLPVDPCTLAGEKKIYEVRGVVRGAETPRGGGADA